MKMGFTVFVSIESCVGFTVDPSPYQETKRCNASLKRREDPVIGQEYLRKSYQADDLK
jgi:hypothetical protein